MAEHHLREGTGEWNRTGERRGHLGEIRAQRTPSARMGHLSLPIRKTGESPQALGNETSSFHIGSGHCRNMTIIAVQIKPTTKMRLGEGPSFPSCNRSCFIYLLYYSYKNIAKQAKPGYFSECSSVICTFLMQPSIFQGNSMNFENLYNLLPSGMHLGRDSPKVVETMLTRC